MHGMIKNNLAQMSAISRRFVVAMAHACLSPLTHDNVVSPQKTTSIFKGQGHTYILKVHAITIRDYKYTYFVSG
jgi:hypothetical protein